MTTVDLDKKVYIKIANGQTMTSVKTRSLRLIAGNRFVNIEVLIVPGLTFNLYKPEKLITMNLK